MLLLTKVLSHSAVKERNAATPTNGDYGYDWLNKHFSNSLEPCIVLPVSQTGAANAEDAV